MDPNDEPSDSDFLVKWSSPLTANKKCLDSYWIVWRFLLKIYSFNNIILDSFTDKVLWCLWFWVKIEF